MCLCACAFKKRKRQKNWQGKGKDVLQGLAFDLKQIINMSVPGLLQQCEPGRGARGLDPG
jgi:hypothetical protein